MSVPNEHVLVIRRELFDQLGSFQGLNFEAQKYLEAFLSRGNNFFIERPEAEINPAYKQIIPYALIAFENKVAYYVRGKKAGEQRLVAKGSIGIGGHMNEASHRRAFKRRFDRSGKRSLGNRACVQTERTTSSKTRSDDHRTNISVKRRIAFAPRNDGDVVADLP